MRRMICMEVCISKLISSYVPLIRSTDQFLMLIALSWPVFCSGFIGIFESAKKLISEAMYRFNMSESIQ